MRVAVLLVLACALALLPSHDARAQGTFGERIIAYGIDVTVERDVLLRRDELRLTEALGHGRSQGAGMRADPVAVVAPRLGALHDAERVEVAV